jgi:DNA-binding transcriptional MerR regulator
MDEDQLISKKDVLEKMGISYGQLYRWKRKGLIPEAWFVRRSTFTGQETFFPQDKILERIEQIVEMKESHPLDDLADVITERVNTKLEVALEKLRKLKWLDDSILEACRIDKTERKVLSIPEMLCVGVLSRIRGVARPEELELVRRTLEGSVKKGLLDRASEQALQLYLLRKRLSGGGISAEISVAMISHADALFDPDVSKVDVVDLKNVLERIKLDLAKEQETTEPPDEQRTEGGERTEEES